MFIKEEGKSLLAELATLSKLAEPVADCWKGSPFYMLPDAVAMDLRNRRHINLPLIEEWDTGRIQKLVSHARAAAGVSDADTDIPPKTNVPPPIRVEMQD